MSSVRLKQVKNARVHAQVRINAPHEVEVLVAGLLVRRHQHAGRQRSRQVGHVLGVGQLVTAPCKPPSRLSAELHAYLPYPNCRGWAQPLL